MPDSDDEFIGRLMQYLREHQTVWVEDCPDEKLRRRIEWGIARARSHGFTWERSLGKFVSLMFRWAPNFDQHPAIAAVLLRTDVPSESRADLLFDLSDAVWQEARTAYDPAGWKFPP